MIFDKTNIEDLVVFQPKIFNDERGCFFESFHEDFFHRAVEKKIFFCQDNESKSTKNVLRGLHFQEPPFEQGKLVRVIKGKVLDVAVDIRKSSKTYGKHFSIVLSEENKKQLWIPKGFAHGFLALDDNTIFSYKCTNYYNPSSERTIRWDSESLNINWGVINPIVSEKDNNSENFTNFVSPF
jgi:dTDP-4-dehydrorhamnose 3,5-epimerase